MITILAADASLCPNTQYATGAWVTVGLGGHMEHSCVQLKNAVGSGDAELDCCIRAVRHTISKLTSPRNHTIVLWSDCMGAVELINQTQKRNRIKTQKSRAQVERLREYVASMGVTLVARHVRGHNNGKNLIQRMNRTCHNIAIKGLRKLVVRSKLGYSVDNNHCVTQ